MQFIWHTQEIGNFIAALVAIVLIYGLLLFALLKTIRRTVPFVILSISFALAIASFLCNLLYAFILVVGISAILFIIVATANMGDLNSFIANPFKTIKTKSGNFGVEKIFDREDLYKKVETAVLNLSKTKTGAIITFERNKSLKNFLKNGVMVNAPVTPELLDTIFYPGTRLHDGAVVIHGNMIVAAAVFFTLTTQPFAVKYGSRHRAAIGISEVSDAVTVVVSEETGRVSIAVNGELEPVDSNNFLRVFETYMSEEINEAEEI
ncbi:MAG: diadenylate cyclase [Bacilli bacterium]|nr:diadenylate cyclase [Bacilli bacterium]